jgi:hypothetical protein
MTLVANFVVCLPQVEKTQSDCKNIVRGTIDKVQVEVVMQFRSIQHLQVTTKISVRVSV